MANLNPELQDEARRRIISNPRYTASIAELRAATNEFDIQEKNIDAANKTKKDPTSDPLAISYANEQIRLAKEAQKGIQKNVDKFREAVANQENESLKAVVADINDPKKKIDDLSPELQSAIKAENDKRAILKKPPIDKTNLTTAIRAVGIRRTTGIQDSDGKEINTDIVQNRRQRQAELIKDPTIVTKTAQFISHGAFIDAALLGRTQIAKKNREAIAKEASKDIGKELQKEESLKIL